MDQVGREHISLEVGPAAAGVPASFTGAAAQVEATRVFQAFVEVLEAGDGVGDQVTNTAVVADQPVPVHRVRTQGRRSDTGNHRRLRAHLC
ncbi:hypothetical protein D9M71_288340 [compost metagenome]